MNNAVNLIATQIVAFGQAPTTAALIAMIFLDLLTGIMAAVRNRRFEFQRIGGFYLSNVVPYLIGYCGLYVFIALNLADNIAPAILDPVKGLTSTPALLALTGSIYDNVKRAQYVPVPTHEHADVSPVVENEPDTTPNG